MPQNRKLTVQPPPDGIVWIEDYRSEDGTAVIPGIASRLGISVSTYKKWRMRGEGPVTFFIGKKAAARIEDVEAYLAGLHQAAVLAARESAATAAHDMRPPEARHHHRAGRRPAAAAA
ncbi:helix-turn-helix transcriptional regulator [Streptomyces wuyuanensis]|uniref:Helix-turn-helix domain-containing protein n=1 Tax=Streptomyces wuyuanensis TaxID=1196353 RepID=A0A1G9ZCD4_9ACTN|nr:hypothetical protein [Streptomyces wuyuanensis]SDN19110.1 hypothetical protein SAMN05444921_12190 [Streptomyces wuyuanensis]